jgi:hypothetical protein
VIDPLEDQVRIYPTTSQTFSQRYIIGARTVEERSDYWIVRGLPGRPSLRGAQAISPPRTTLPNHRPKRLGARKPRFRSSATLPPALRAH